VAKYREKHPATVEAEQFGGFYAQPWPAGVEGDGQGGFYMAAANGMKVPVVAGEWVVTLPGGNRISYTDEHFRATYEPAD
jgi:hypothetical protein